MCDDFWILVITVTCEVHRGQMKMLAFCFPRKEKEWMSLVREDGFLGNTNGNMLLEITRPQQLCNCYFPLFGTTGRIYTYLTAFIECHHSTSATQLFLCSCLLILRWREVIEVDPKKIVNLSVASWPGCRSSRNRLWKEGFRFNLNVARFGFGHSYQIIRSCKSHP